MSSNNSRLRKPVLMHRNRSKWDRLLTAGDVRGQKFVEREGKRKLPVEKQTYEELFKQSNIENFQIRQRRLQGMIEKGATVNQIRQELELPVIEGGDVPVKVDRIDVASVEIEPLGVTENEMDYAKAWSDLQKAVENHT